MAPLAKGCPDSAEECAPTGLSVGCRRSRRRSALPYVHPERGTSCLPPPPHAGGLPGRFCSTAKTVREQALQCFPPQTVQRISRRSDDSLKDNRCREP